MSKLNVLTEVTPFKLNVVKASTEYSQLIYASQLYGTFFAVGVKLNLVNNDKELASIDLTLVNYKGLYNLGMSDLTKISFSPDGKSALLTLHLSAFSGIHGNGKTLNLICKDSNLNKLKSMDVVRQLHTFSNHPDSQMVNHLNDRFFDSEFYERDGAAIFKRNRMDDRVIEFGKEVKDEYGKILKPHADIGGVCRASSIVFVG